MICCLLQGCAGCINGRHLAGPDGPSTTELFAHQRRMTMGTEATISIRIRPAALELAPRHTAVVVVDMQNDFGATGGSSIVPASTSHPFKRLCRPSRGS